MTAPAKLGCRVLDKDGDDCTPAAYRDDGMAEWMALGRASYMAIEHPQWAPYTVIRVTTVTLHTIHATREGM